MSQKKLIEKKETKKIEIKSNPIDQELLKKIALDLDSSVVKIDSSNESKSFFRQVVKDMNDPKNISMKTEYISIPENFNGTKLDFLATFGNMPYLKQFVRIFETKRVSYQRKGRQEDVMLLQERRNEQQVENMQNLGKLFGVNQ